MLLITHVRNQEILMLIKYNNYGVFIILCVGIILISLTLCVDAVIGNVQEKTMKEYKSSNSEMVSFWVFLFFVVVVVTIE